MYRCLPVLLLLPSLCLAAGPSADSKDVLKVAYGYPDGGAYNKQWKGSGTPEAIRFKGKEILAKGKGTYCCGLTFTVAFKVAEARGLLKDKSPESVKQFQKQWYGVPAPSTETLCVFAAEKLKVGKRVKLKDARPGDFVQFWRESKSGHSVIFLAWVQENGKAVGFRYRSSQGSTKGIGDRVEYFSDAAGHKGRVVRARTYVCRLDAKPR